MSVVPKCHTFGPVEELEPYLEKDWWDQIFTSTYLKTDGNVVENSVITKKEVDSLINNCYLQKNTRILDLCCGQGRHSLELSRQGFSNITGVDGSKYLLSVAKKRACQENLVVTFKKSDARLASFSQNSFDCILLLGNSFGYFETSEDDVTVLKNIYNWLEPKIGFFVLEIADGEWLRKNFEPRSWEWVDATTLVCRERSLSKDSTRLVCREVIVDANQGVVKDQFYAERLYSEQEIKCMLSQVGFRVPECTCESYDASNSNQDFGMMEHRLIFNCTKKTEDIKLIKRDYRVTVLLGDPRLPDSVKLGGKFNVEDFETIAKMKEALTKIEGYKFTYIDNHATMFETLKNMKQDFVLNLCDEGFKNDATLELHIPAYLDMLGIPYSGAGTACLGSCYDKSLVCAVAQSLAIPVPVCTYVEWQDKEMFIPSTFPLLLKPNCGDSSIGITKDAVCNNEEEYETYLKKLYSDFPGKSVLVQEFLSGVEYSVGIVGNKDDYKILPILEVDYAKLTTGYPKILGYESKWEPESVYWNTVAYKKAELDERVRKLLVEYSVKLFERLKCQDYARFDWRCDSYGSPNLLEVNPNPGWCWDGKMNLMSGMDGMNYVNLLELIVESARKRIEKL